MLVASRPLACSAASTVFARASRHRPARYGARRCTVFDACTFNAADDGDGSSSCRRRWRLRSTATAVKSTEADASVGASAALNHTPVLLQEVLQFFRGIQLRTFVDGTLGAGGHSAAIACHHSELERLIGIDQDQSALDVARPRLEAAVGEGVQLHLERCNFREVEAVLARATGGPLAPTCDGMLLDLGVSSMQVDRAERGFSFMRDGPLDMRMALAGGGSGGCGGVESAEDLVNHVDEGLLGRILRDYGEERAWRSIASRIVAAREEHPIRTTHQLVAAIGGGRAQRSKGGRRGIHPATRTFQALRIAVNDELGALAAALPAAISCLVPGGRLAVISFHSLEDRVVKRAFLAAAGRPHDAEPLPLHVDPRDVPLPPVTGRLITRRPVTAGGDEAECNPRSRSAKLRILEKV